MLSVIPQKYTWSGMCGRISVISDQLSVVLITPHFLSVQEHSTCELLSPLHNKSLPDISAREGRSILRKIHASLIT